MSAGFLRRVRADVATAVSARRQAYLTLDNLVAIYCPGCTAREFGESFGYRDAGNPL